MGPDYYPINAYYPLEFSFFDFYVSHLLVFTVPFLLSTPSSSLLASPEPKGGRPWSPGCLGNRGGENLCKADPWGICSLNL